MSTAERVVHTLGRFELRRHLGRGAMGDVDLAWDPHTEREVALKWMRIETSDPDAVEAERNGAELQRRVAAIAPQVAGVFEYGELDDALRGRLFYVAMEPVDGTDLAALLRASRGQPLDLEQALRIMDELCSVLKTLHEFQTEIDGRLVKSVLHGDIKPENLRLQPGRDGGPERLRILDFGVAKHLTLTRQATVNLFGSYPYTPPERLRTGMVDERSDLWAAGVILFQMLTGRSPYAGQTPEQLEQQVRTQQAATLYSAAGDRYSAALCAVVDRCLSFEPERRYSSARELQAAISDLRRSPQLRAAAPSPSVPPPAPGSASARSAKRTKSAGADSKPGVGARTSGGSASALRPAASAEPASVRGNATQRTTAEQGDALDATRRTVVPAGGAALAAARETNRELSASDSSATRRTVGSAAPKSGRDEVGRSEDAQKRDPKVPPPPPLPPLPVPPSVPPLVGAAGPARPTNGEASEDDGSSATRRTPRTPPPPTPPTASVERPEVANPDSGPQRWQRSLRRWWLWPRRPDGRIRRWVWITTVVILVLQYTAHNAARSVVSELSSDANPDVESALATYRYAASVRPFDLGLGEAQEVLREALVESADQVIASFLNETTTPKQGDWQRARDHLEAALELEHRDPQVRAKLYYAQAHDDRIEARTAWNRRDRTEAQQLWDRAIFGFERAAEVDESWPDPYLGLARIYAYEVFDLDKLEQALRAALGRGYSWVDREKAQLADAHRTEASRQIAAADELSGERRERELLLDARRHLELAIAMYEQILDFGNAKTNRDLAQAALDELEPRLRGRRRL